MKHTLLLSALLWGLALVSCSTPEMASVAARVQEARQTNANSAQAARIRIWRDISTCDKQGWHLHSQQTSRLPMPAEEFQTARSILTTKGYTIWKDHPGTQLPPRKALPDQIVELEWLNEHNEVAGGINITRICRESEQEKPTGTAFPFVLPDDAYDQFMALPTISKALQLLRP